MSTFAQLAASISEIGEGRRWSPRWPHIYLVQRGVDSRRKTNIYKFGMSAGGANDRLYDYVRNDEHARIIRVWRITGDCRFVENLIKKEFSSLFLPGRRVYQKADPKESFHGTEDLMIQIIDRIVADNAVADADADAEDAPVAPAPVVAPTPTTRPPRRQAAIDAEAKIKQILA